MFMRVQGTVELITIVMSGVVVHSVYKPPNDQFVLPALGHRDLPHIVIGYFNSHSTSWEKRLNSGQIHATSQSSMMLNCRNPSTVQDGRKATTQISSASGSIANMCKK